MIRKPVEQFKKVYNMRDGNLSDQVVTMLGCQ